MESNVYSKKDLKQTKEELKQYGLSFNSLNEIKQYIKDNPYPDCFILKDNVYTQEEYDMAGREIVYANRKTSKIITVFTDDRYKLGNKGLKLEMEDACSYRTDITYAE